LQSTGAVLEVAVSAALPANGKANTLANRAPYIQALELRVRMLMTTPLSVLTIPNGKLPVA
jgi:hypothetical protein